jgi:hypothetical protein
MSGDKRYWSKAGKTWSRLSHVKAHLSMYTRVPRFWEVVVYEVVEQCSFPAHDIDAASVLDKEGAK